MDLGRIFRKKSSREIAKDRLKILLISDMGELFSGNDGDDKDGYCKGHFQVYEN